MPVTRTIYTQGSVRLQATSGATQFGSNLTAVGGVVLSGVQSANFTVNSPKQDVNSFGVLGAINKVQVEPQSATMEVTVVVNSGNATTNWLSGLAADSQLPTPSGIVVTASGIGQLTGAILTAFRFEAAVGAIPTLALTFEGISGTNVLTAPAAPSTLSLVTVDVATPANFGTIYWSAAPGGGWTGCPQSIRTSWEMPVERINCLGNDINAPSVFSRPPGTLSFTVEGIDYNLVGCYATGLQIGPFKLAYAGAGVRETSRTVNMAVGEAAATYNVTSESVAMGAIISGA